MVVFLHTVRDGMGSQRPVSHLFPSEWKLDKLCQLYQIRYSNEHVTLLYFVQIDAMFYNGHIILSHFQVVCWECKWIIHKFIDKYGFGKCSVANLEVMINRYNGENAEQKKISAKDAQ